MRRCARRGFDQSPWCWRWHLAKAFGGMRNPCDGAAECSHLEMQRARQQRAREQDDSNGRIQDCSHHRTGYSVRRSSTPRAPGARWVRRKDGLELSTYVVELYCGGGF